MERSHVTRMRGFSFAIPALMDGMLGMVQVAIPLLAIRFGATAWFLGMLGWTAQGVRFPVTLSAGALSERIGRTRVIIPAAFLAALACVGLALARNNNEVLIAYILLMAAIGAFYPALQAFIGDQSPQGELRKNLSAFNIGWTSGGAICGLLGGYLLAAGRALPFSIGTVLAVGSMIFVFAWAHSAVGTMHAAEDAETQPATAGPGPLLFIARTGHFLGFFGYAVARSLFPKLGVELGFSEGEIGVLVGLLIVGQALGIFIASAGPWWRGKLWPQILAQGMAMASGLLVFATSSKLLFAAAFLTQGIALSIAYTAALYYGLQARTNMGRNTGIHESLVAAGNIIGSFIGGAVAQFISLRAPYLTFAGLSLLAIIVSLSYWRFSTRPTSSPKTSQA